MLLRELESIKFVSRGKRLYFHDAFAVSMSFSQKNVRQ